MAKRMSFKVSILTPWTLLPPKIPASECTDDPANKFAELLCYRTRVDLLRFAFWPRARGEAYICSSFDAFEERFLHYSEYAVIVLSGHHVSCLDNIYPRLLVFFTMRPSWSARFLLVLLGEPEGRFRFDTRMLTHEPIIFTGSPEDHWSSDEDSWTKLFNILKADYCPERSVDTRHRLQTFNSGAWMSVTDLRGHHLAVKVTQRPPQSYTNPPSWNDLRDCGSGELTQRTLNYNSQSPCSPSARARSRLLGFKRRRVDSENLHDPYGQSDDEEYRSSSLPRFPVTCISSRSGTACSSPIPRVNAELSPYMRRHAAIRFSTDPMKIEENEEKMYFGQGTSNLSYTVPQLPPHVVEPVSNWRPMGEEKRVVISPLGEADLIVTVEHSSSKDHQISSESTPFSNEQLPSTSLGKAEIIARGNSVSASTECLSSETQFVENTIGKGTHAQHENKASQTLVADEPSDTERGMLDGSFTRTEKDERTRCTSPQNIQTATEIHYDTQSSIFVDHSTGIIFSSSDSLPKGVPETPPSSPIEVDLCFPCTSAVCKSPFLGTRLKHEEGNASDSLGVEVTPGLLENQTNAEVNSISHSNFEHVHERITQHDRFEQDSGLDSESVGYLDDLRQRIFDSNGEETNITSACRNYLTWEAKQADDDETDNAVDDITQGESGSITPTLFVPVNVMGQESIAVSSLDVEKSSGLPEVRANPACPSGENDDIKYDGGDHAGVTAVTMSSKYVSDVSAKANTLSPSNLNAPRDMVQQEPPSEQTSSISKTREEPKLDENEQSNLDSSVRIEPISVFLKATAADDSLRDEKGHITSVDLVGRGPPLNINSAYRTEQPSSTSELGHDTDRHVSVLETPEDNSGIELVSVFLTAKALGNIASGESVPINPAPFTTQGVMGHESVSIPASTSISLSERFENSGYLSGFEHPVHDREAERVSMSLTSTEIEKSTTLGDRSFAGCLISAVDLVEHEPPPNTEPSILLKEESISCDIPKVPQGHLGARENPECVKYIEVDSSLVSVKPTEIEDLTAEQSASIAPISIALLASIEHKQSLNTNLSMEDEQISGVSKGQDYQKSPTSNYEDLVHATSDEVELRSTSVPRLSSDDLILSAIGTPTPSSDVPRELAGDKTEHNTNASVKLRQTSALEDPGCYVCEPENPEYGGHIKADLSGMPLKPTGLEDSSIVENTSVAPSLISMDSDEHELPKDTSSFNSSEQVSTTPKVSMRSECHVSAHESPVYGGPTERKSSSVSLKPTRGENEVAVENVFIAPDSMAPVDLVEREPSQNTNLSRPLEQTGDCSKPPVNPERHGSKHESQKYGDHIEAALSSRPLKPNEVIDLSASEHGSTAPISMIPLDVVGNESAQNTNLNTNLQQMSLGSQVPEDPERQVYEKGNRVFNKCDLGLESSSVSSGSNEVKKLNEVENGSTLRASLASVDLVGHEPSLNTNLSIHSEKTASDPEMLNDPEYQLTTVESPVHDRIDRDERNLLSLTRKLSEDFIRNRKESMNPVANLDLLGHAPLMDKNPSSLLEQSSPSSAHQENRARLADDKLKPEEDSGIELESSSISEPQTLSRGINQGEHGSTNLYSFVPLELMGSESLLEGNSLLPSKQNDRKAQNQQDLQNSYDEHEALPFDSANEVEPILVALKLNNLVYGEPPHDKTSSESEVLEDGTPVDISKTPYQQQTLVHTKLSIDDFDSPGLSENPHVSYSKTLQDKDLLYYTEPDRQRLVAEPVPSDVVPAEILNFDSMYHMLSHPHSEAAHMSEAESVAPIKIVKAGTVEPIGAALESEGVPNGSSDNSEEHYLTRSAEEETNTVFPGIVEQFREVEEEPRSGQSTVTYDQTIAPYRPRAWNLMGLSSLVDFVTGYIPRHARWLYASTFQSREELMNVIASQTIRLNIQGGLRNPVYVTLVFLGITTVSPHISRLPQLVAQLVDTADFYLFVPTFWINRPILSHMNLITHRMRQALSWSDSATITSFPQYPWHMASPTDQT